MIGAAQPMIGRVHEQSLLMDALERAAGGEPSMIIVEGEAGIGKTRLTEWARAEAEHRSFRVLAGSTPRLSGIDIPFSPFVAALRGVFDWPTSRGGAWKVGDGRALVFESVVGTLSQIATAQPLLLVLEDMHWADQSTWDLLAYLAGSLGTTPASVIVTLRRHPGRSNIRKSLAELRRYPGIQVLQMRPLLDAEIAEIVAGYAGSWQLEKIQSIAQGNPFVAIELAEVRSGDGIPDSLTDAVRARIDSCPDDVRIVLEAMAVCDQDTDDGLLGDVVALGLERLANAMRAAINLGLVVSREDLYQLRHTLTRSVILGDMLPSQRRAWHAKFAEMIEHRAKDRDVDILNLAHHWHQAGVPSKAAPIAYQAGVLALLGRAFPEASRLLQRAVDLWRRADQPEGQYPLVLAQAAEAARWAGEPERAVHLIKRALELPEVRYDTDRRAALLERLGRYQWESGRLHDMVSAYQEAEQVLTAHPQAALLAAILAAHATGLMIMGDYAEARNLATRAVDLARQSGSLSAEGHAAATLGVLHAHMKSMPEAIAELRRAQVIARRCSDVEVAIRATVNLSYMLCVWSRFEEAIDAIASGRAMIKDLGGTLSDLADLDHNIVAIYVAMGRYDDALGLIDELAGRPAGAMASYLPVLRLEVMVARGGDTAAAQRLSGALRMEKAGPRMATTVDACEAEMALWRGDAVRGIALVSSGLEALNRESDYIVGHARLVAAGFRALADEAATPKPLASSAAAVTPSTAFVDELERRLAWLETRIGSEPEADAYILTARAERCRLRHEEGTAWREACDAWVRARQPFREAYVLLRMAENELRHGHRDRASRTLRKAARIAHWLRAEPLTDQLRRTAVAARLGEQVDRPDAVDTSNSVLDDLTSREQQVLALLIAGASNRKIARDLYISERTAAAHVANVLRKFGVHKRTEAVAEALRRQVS